ncbi:NUDIX domain-containing protein [Arsenicicoccus sp. oral taxon 190]|uniref:NUDIX domain-containing protein n=1 Tax=Arsenicicoccus sp. oral taxon 190 TaxID=1658671 RepID=UPI000679F1E5|nr:NUDIX hydrolase [Arsenicicoccus sp. oral taxon 190]AKT51687.1 ADP-ribose pyrophosphatase [Arsenicicoccus sp. oral taxon 190]
MPRNDFRGHPQLARTDVVDRIDPRPVVESHVIHEGYVFDLVSETADLGEAGQVRREFLRHPGAVAVVALDSEDRVVLIQQYRHPVGAFEWEIPAGLLDVAGEDPAVAVARELHEEADLRAERWDVLIDYWTTPGGNDEAIRIYLARDLSLVPEDEWHEREDEERDMPTGWLSLDDARAAVLAGQLHNPSTVVGVLAAHASRADGWASLRPADSPWPEHPAHR